MEEPNKKMNATLKFSYGRKSISNNKLTKRITSGHEDDQYEVDSIKSSMGLD